MRFATLVALLAAATAIPSVRRASGEASSSALTYGSPTVGKACATAGESCTLCKDALGDGTCTSATVCKIGDKMSTQISDNGCKAWTAGGAAVKCKACVGEALPGNCLADKTCGAGVDAPGGAVAPPKKKL